MADNPVRPRLLDLFCGAGGAATGYHRAGFDVTGVDIEPQPRYPFEFVQADALEYLAGLTWLELATYQAIHASPPCQAYSTLRRMRPERDYPDLVSETRDALRATGLPYIIENVEGAPLENAVRLCGGGLGLGSEGYHLQRHRRFECSGFEVGLVPPCSHFGRQALGVYGSTGRNSNRGYSGLAHQRKEGMGIDWMRGEELTQAIPPAYTEFLGSRLSESLSAAEAVA